MRDLIKKLPYFRDLYAQIAQQQLELQRWRTWKPPGHFYSPIPSLDEVRRHAEQIFDSTRTDIGAVDLNPARQAQLLELLAPLYKDIPFGDQPRLGFRYHFKNQYFSYADGVILFCMLRHIRPKRIIEIGSGYSSALMLDTNDRFLDRSVDFTFIEPHPERLESLIWEIDRASTTILRQSIQSTPISTFKTLEAGDILFIDSSHVSKTGSDVNFLVFEILPAIAPGVLVHFHDVFYPFEYPEDWVAEGVAWNEAYLLRAFLQYNEKFSVEFFVSYVMRHLKDRVSQLMPLALKGENTKISLYEDAPGGSIWLIKTPALAATSF
jgi:predicted O-methyltransferase YrrM